MDKTYNHFDNRTNRDVTLTRVETKCQCVGCFFLDEETAECLAPMPIDLGDDCMESNTEKTIHFQFREQGVVL
jgi:hypothetical protein